MIFLMKKIDRKISRVKVLRFKGGRSVDANLYIIERRGVKWKDVNLVFCTIQSMAYARVVMYALFYFYFYKNNNIQINQVYQYNTNSKSL